MAKPARAQAWHPLIKRIADRELDSAIRAGLRIGPGFPVAIARPQVDLRKLILEILELRTLLHRLFGRAASDLRRLRFAGFR